MTKRAKVSETDRIDAAFNRVLSLEAEARERVEECRREAAAIIAAAEERAKSVSERADLRLRRAHAIADASVARALHELLAKAPETNGVDGLRSVPGLDESIDTLVDEILGSVPGIRP
jgi:hypothetical protein